MGRATYASLIENLETELEACDALGMVFMDGDGSDPAYRTAHRALKLDRRRVIEDAIQLDSRHSQLEQMADLVAWTAYSAVDRHNGNEFAWDWYASFLAERDANRGPRKV